MRAGAFRWAPPARPRRAPRPNPNSARRRGGCGAICPRVKKMTTKKKRRFRPAGRAVQRRESAWQPSVFSNGRRQRVRATTGGAGRRPGAALHTRGVAMPIAVPPAWSLEPCCARAARGAAACEPEARATLPSCRRSRKPRTRFEARRYPLGRRRACKGVAARRRPEPCAPACRGARFRDGVPRNAIDCIPAGVLRLHVHATSQGALIGWGTARRTCVFCLLI